MPDTTTIQDEALLAISTGDFIQAANLYASLEEQAPGVGTWSLRLGDCLRRAGQGQDAVLALTRAVEAYMARHKLAKAASICEQILEIDAQNSEIRAVLARLDESNRGASEHAAAPAPFRQSDLTLMAEDPMAEAPLSEEDSTAETKVPSQPTESSRAATATKRSLPRVVLPLTPFFSALDQHQVRLLNSRARLVQLSPGEIVYAAGEPSEMLFVVASGEIAVLVPQEVARLKPGDVFGEEAVVLPGHTRMATLRAAEPSQLLVLDLGLVNELIRGTPVLIRFLSEWFCDRSINMLARTSPMLASLPESERMAQFARFRCDEVEKGSLICKPGDASQGLFVLLAGAAVAAFDDKLTERLQPGDVFGEISLVTDSTVGVGVTAHAKCFVLHLPRADFESVRSTWPAVAEYLKALAENRLARMAQARLEDAPVFQSVPLPARILVIHGEDETRQCYERALGEAGFLVDATGDAATATEMITSRRYDVVLYNLGAFGQAGNHLLRNLRKRDLDVPVILTTRYEAFDRTSATANYSVVRSFVEPLNVDDLVRTASRAVHFHRLTRVRREAMTRLNSSGEWMGDRTGLEYHFDSALGCLSMAFQPIVSAADNSVFAFEALLRSGEELLHSPVAVFRAAERLNRVHDVGRIARDTIAATMAGSADPPILFVNVHSHDLLDPHLLDPGSHISSFATRIVLEITERTPLDELHDLGVRIKDLRALGYRFALDNLGAGHAGVGSLAQLEPEVCKLDALLIRGIDGDSVKRDLVRAMLAVCRDMNILTICAGVETLAERDALLQLGGDLMQGYLFAKPGPAFPSVDFSTLGPLIQAR